jgi:hypothetical protein
MSHSFKTGTWLAAHAQRPIPYCRLVAARSHAAIRTQPPRDPQCRHRINAFGWRQPIVVDDDGVILAGHARFQAAMRLGLERVPVHVASGLGFEAARAYRLTDNRTHEEARWHPDMLNLELHELGATGFDLALTGFDPIEMSGEQTGFTPVGETKLKQPSLTLAERFGIPPFSVLNAREGWWQARKRAWIDIGIRSALGRGAPIGGAPMPMDRATANELASYRDQVAERDPGAETQQAHGRAGRIAIAGKRLREIEGPRRWARQANTRWVNASEPQMQCRRAEEAAHGPEFNRKRTERMAARTTNLTFVKGSRDTESLDP